MPSFGEHFQPRPALFSIPSQSHADGAEMDVCSEPTESAKRERKHLEIQDPFFFSTPRLSKSPTDPRFPLVLTRPQKTFLFLSLSLFLFLFSLPCSATPATDAPSSTSASAVPTPLVVIDNTSDSFATVVTLKFGDRLGELLDTVAALRNLGLNIRRAKVSAAGGANKFFITDAATSEKVRVVFFMFFFF